MSAQLGDANVVKFFEYIYIANQKYPDYQRLSTLSDLGIAAHASFCPALILSFHACDFGLPFNAVDIFCLVSGGIVRLVLL